MVDSPPSGCKKTRSPALGDQRKEALGHFRQWAIGSHSRLHPLWPWARLLRWGMTTVGGWLGSDGIKPIKPQFYDQSHETMGNQRLTYETWALFSVEPQCQWGFRNQLEVRFQKVVLQSFRVLSWARFGITKALGSGSSRSWDDSALSVGMALLPLSSGRPSDAFTSKWLFNRGES
jgi:hypothetical protein